jgi:centromere protein C
MLYMCHLLTIISPYHSHLDADHSGSPGTGLTPTQVLSTRKSLRGTSIPPPRSSSPRKTGINGSARRSNGIDVLSLGKDLPVIDPEDRENTPILTPTRPAPGNIRRFSPSPEKSPLRQVITNGPAPSRSAKSKQWMAKELPANRIDYALEVVSNHTETKRMISAVQQGKVEPPADEEYVDFAPNGDYSDVSINGDLNYAAGVTPEENNDEQMHESIEMDEPEEVALKSKTQDKRGGRKRKSESLEEEQEALFEPSPPRHPSKKVKPSRMEQPEGKVSKDVDHSFPLDPTIALGTQNKSKGHPAGKRKPQNPPLSTQQEAELGQIIERVRARPGQPKSLYILRRETPADDSAVHTRSGRISVKPLAYWRNERCVYGGSPGGVSLSDGARFPLNSIKEIIRTEEVASRRSRSPSRGKRKGKKGKSKSRAGTAESEIDSNSDSDQDPAWIDRDAEEWEASSGIYRGDVSIWDHDQQAPLDALEEVELAYAPASIQTKEVKSMHPDQRTFKFAKLLSTGFFGSGIVELAPGDLKRPKNSRKMHMSFFVAKGRVTVEVGSLGGEMSRFSIGKGGFWHVPRGEYPMSRRGRC